MGAISHSATNSPSPGKVKASSEGSHSLTGEFCTSGKERDTRAKELGNGQEKIHAGADRRGSASGRDDP